jgi:D-alanyl-D-alanine carboxypeptidase
MPLMDFLRKHVFTPLDMQNVTNVDQGRPDVTGYLRYALGPPRLAPKEGKGWLFAAGELGMPARELAKWDIAMMKESLLQPSSYRQMETDTLLKNGLGTHYGLGLGVRAESGHRALEHGGEISGFTAENVVFPDDGRAIVVLTNQDAANAASDIAQKIKAFLFSDDATSVQQKERQARQIFEGLQRGHIDRSLFTPDANSYFTEEAVHDFAASLGPLGSADSFNQTTKQDRGGMTFRSFKLHYKDRTLHLSIREMPDGKIEQFQVTAE